MKEQRHATFGLIVLWSSDINIYDLELDLWIGKSLNFKGWWLAATVLYNGSLHAEEPYG